MARNLYRSPGDVKSGLPLPLQLDMRNMRILTDGNFGYRIGKVTPGGQAHEILDQRALRARFRNHQDPRIGGAIVASGDEQQMNRRDAVAVAPDVDQRAVVQKRRIHRRERVLTRRRKRA